MKRVELWINNTLVDINENGVESLFIISKQIQDIKEPQSRQTDYSRNIQIPGSKNNDILFSYVFELGHDIQNSTTTNFNPDFNPNLKANAVAYLDGVEFFNGIAQLTQVNINHKRHVVYNITLLGKLANIFTNIGEGELKDLDMSEFDHNYNVGNIVNSWTAPEGQGYVYPLIDYGFSPDLQNYSVNNLYPAFYAKEYIDKIFSAANFTYTSTFFNSNFFKHLIIPFSSSQLKLTSEQVLARRFRAENTIVDSFNVPVGVQNASGTVIVFNNDSTPPNFDTSSQYNTNTGVLHCSLAGVYSFVGQIRVTGTFTPDTAGVTVRSQYAIRCMIEVVLSPAGGLPAQVLQTSFVDINLGTTTFQTTYTTANPGLLNPIDPHYDNSPFNPRNYINIVAPNVTLGVGDAIALRCNVYALRNQYGVFNNVSAAQKFQDTGTGVFYDGSFTLNIESGSIFYNTIDNTQIIEGQDINMNNALPQKVKQKDFLLSIFKMFNLYVEQDPEVENNLLIETRNSYYNNTVIDLTQKRDISKDLVIKPMGALDARKYLFRYKEDSDYYNKIYNDSHPLDYGEREIVIDNDFIKGTKTTEIIFSPTPYVGSTASDRVVPRIIKVSDTGIVSPHEGNIRILYYGGVKDTNQAWNLNSSGQVYTYGEYPYAGHLDDPYESTVDLCFYPPDVLYEAGYFHPIWYTANNIYNAYWKQFIEEITDKNSKLVTGWFRLNALDIKKMDFRNLYFFDDEYFRLNRIIDYNPISEGVTQCEFIKIKAAVPFQTSSGQLSDGQGEAIDEDLLPGIVWPGGYNQNTGEAGDVIINGSENRVSENSRNVFIQGRNNVVGDYSDNVFLGNSSGVLVHPGVKNATVFNTHDKTIRHDDVYMVGGQGWFGNEAIGTLTYVDPASSENDGLPYSTFLIDTSSGDVTINLRDPKEWVGLSETYKKIDNSGNDVILLPFAGSSIDNASSLIWSIQMRAYKITSDGENYWITGIYG